MKLYDFLFQKGVLRKFKRNWLRYRYYHRASKSIQDKEFNDWLELWGEHPDAILMAFSQSGAKYGKKKYWSRIDNDWRAYLNEDCRHIENTYNTLKQLYNSKRTNKTKRDE